MPNEVTGGSTGNSNPSFRPIPIKDLPHGFNKQATQEDTIDAMVKRGIVEDPADKGKPADGFVLPG